MGSSACAMGYSSGGGCWESRSDRLEREAYEAEREVAYKAAAMLAVYKATYKATAVTVSFEPSLKLQGFVKFDVLRSLLRQYLRTLPKGAIDLRKVVVKYKHQPSIECVVTAVKVSEPITGLVDLGALSFTVTHEVLPNV